MSTETIKTFRHALEANDIPSMERAVREHPELLTDGGSRPALAWARTVPMAERLLALGADIEALSTWWGPGLGTRHVDASVAEFLVQRGAQLTVHAAAGLGLVDRLAAMVEGDPALVDAKGCDGCTPLHFARNCAIAKLLVSRGARIDARDDDHDSTPAQWLIGDAPEVTRFLLEKGASPDIFLAAALGDRTLAENLIRADGHCLSCRTGKAPEFPPLGHRGRGGTIYQWTLGFNSYPHQIALRKGHSALFDYLFEQSDTATRFLVCCVLARRSEAQAIAARNPDLVSSLPSVDLELLPRYCWETNLNFDVVQLMLDLGFPVAHPEMSHGYTALHNAAWAGAADLVQLLLERGHPVDIVDPRYNATPLGFALHDCLVEKRHPEGQFARVIELLLDAGSPWDPLCFPTGDSRLDNVLRPRLHLKAEGAALLGDEAAAFRLLGDTPSSESLARALGGAAKGGHATLCRRLLQSGAPATGKAYSNSHTPLMYALQSGSTETAAVLREFGA